MRIEATLRPEDARTVSGVRGAKSRAFAKTFRNEAAQEAWLEKNGEDVTVYEIAGTGR